VKMHPIHGLIEGAAIKGLKVGGRTVLKVAKERAPEDTSGLKNSGRVVQDDLEVIVKFTAPHAWLQHEKLEYEHPNGGQAKYLESAALETDIAEPVARHVRAVLKSG